MWERVVGYKNQLNWRIILSIGITVILLLGLGIALLLLKNPQIFKSRAAGSPTFNFYGKEIRLLKLFGQTKITETSLNKVTPNKIYHSSGVIVDRSSTPNKIYVVDTGNNRVLGFNGMGYCSTDSSKFCTIDSDCDTGGKCNIDGTKNADIIFGQADFESAACNRDNNLGFNKKPTESTLCMIGYPLSTNIAEYWMRTNFDVDKEGNLYVPDVWNNRILKFNQPFNSDKSNGKGDTAADFVIGQKDFISNGINQNLNQSTYSSLKLPNNQSLWINAGPPDHVSNRGVSVDNSGNVWVADTFNNRILRFPPNSKGADLVLGQKNFTSNGCVFDGSLDKMCTPTLARVDPETGNLYVIDEYPAPFKARILIFNPPFTNGMTASKSIVPTEGPSGYIFNGVTGFIFNTYKGTGYETGKLWVHDGYSRTILIDDNGNVIKVINAIDKNHTGGDFTYDGCGSSIYDGFNLWSPGGSIGMDSANNLYFADERFHRIARYALPYEIRAVGDKTCLPLPNGGLFPGIGANIQSDNKLGESIGTVAYGNQLIVNDGNSIKVWNDYLNKTIGSTADIIVRGGTPGGIWFGDAVDDTGKIWMSDEWGKLRIYQLPFKGGDVPLVDNIHLYWKDTGDEISYNFFETGITFDNVSKAIYISDSSNHRILRIKNYTDFKSKLFVDMVIGQPDKTTVKCNHNQNDTGLPPTADSLCVPRQVRFDKLGNLYVVENTYECHGNDRITVFLADDIKNVQEGILFPNLSAKKVFGPPNLNSRGPCAYDTKGMPGSPVTIAFNSANQMVIGNDGYYGDAEERQSRQIWFYADPLNKQTPDGYINLPMGSAGEITFDSANNLIIQDHTWSRVWIINPGIDPSWLVPLSGGIIPYLTPISTTQTPTPTISPVLSSICAKDKRSVSLNWSKISGAENYVIRLNKNPKQSDGDYDWNGIKSWSPGSKGDQIAREKNTDHNFLVDSDSEYSWKIQPTNLDESKKNGNEIYGNNFSCAWHNDKCTPGEWDSNKCTKCTSNGEWGVECTDYGVYETNAQGWCTCAKKCSDIRYPQCE